jgi:hypothetical protein
VRGAVDLTFLNDIFNPSADDSDRRPAVLEGDGRALKSMDIGIGEERGLAADENDLLGV